jgi:hypothetical protein
MALVMLDGELHSEKNDPYYTRQFYKSIQAFADASLQLCEEGRFKKLQRFLAVAEKLFRDGNATVKNGIENVYLYTLSHAFGNPSQGKWIEPFLSNELRLVCKRLHYVSGD